MGSSDQAPRIVRGSHRERRAATRAKVLEAGIQCLFEHGYHATTTTLVAETAGVSRGALLHQFPTRVEMVIAIGEHIMVRHEAVQSAILGTMNSPLDQFKGLTDVLWEKNKRPDTIALIEIFLATRTDPQLAEALQGRINQTIDKSLVRTRGLAETAGINDGPAVDALAILTIASMLGLAVLELNYWKREQIEGAFDLLKNNRDRWIDRLRK